MINNKILQLRQLKQQILNVIDIDIPKDFEDSIRYGLDKKYLKKTLKDLNDEFIGGEDLTYESILEAIFGDNRLTVKEDNYPF